MADFTPEKSPDYYTSALNNELTPKAHYEEVDVTKTGKEQVEFSVGTQKAILDTKNNVVRIVEAGGTKQEVQKLSEKLTLEQKLKKIDEIYRLENLDKILSKYEGKRMIELYLNDLGGKFDEQNNIVIGEKIIIKGTKEYNHIIIKIFESLKEFAKDLIKYNAKEK